MMGKKKQAKKAAKAASSGPETTTARVIPKSIAGMKVPKEMRAVGDALIAKANTPQGREVIASGLALAATAAAAAAAASAGRQRRQSEHAGEAAPAVPPGPGAAGTQPIDPQGVADAIGDAAGMILTQLFGARLRH